jgi:hypothetical protein
MAFRLNDRVLETSTTIGTGALTLLGPPSGYQSFFDGVGSDNTTYYAAFNTTQDEWELGLGTLNAGATELTRTTVFSSSNSNNAVNFSVGVKNVFVTFPASQTFTIQQNLQTAGYTLSVLDNGQLINITTGGVTVPAGVFLPGNVVTIYNNSTSNQTITEGASVTLRYAGTASTGNRTLGQRGIATVLCVAANDFIITGVGIS